MSKYYAGIGSRETPTEIMQRMVDAAASFERMGLILRSGGAAGADTAFAIGVNSPDNKEIYLPWQGFNSLKGGMTVSSEAYAEAERISKLFHPAWNNLGRSAKTLMIRNVFQITGHNPFNIDNLSRFVLCWTKDGANGTKERPTSWSTGGTGQAIRIAHHYGIPVFNMAREEDIQDCKSYVASITGENVFNFAA